MNGRPQPLSPERLLEHDRFLRAVARGILDAGSAEDVVQQTFLAALRHLPRRSTSLRAWLATVTRNLALKVRRAESRRRRREEAAARPERLPSTEEIAERVTVFQPDGDVRREVQPGRREEVRLSVERRFTIGGSVVEVRTGEPVEGIDLHLQYEGKGGYYAFGQTGAGGRFRSERAWERGKAAILATLTDPGRAHVLARVEMGRDDVSDLRLEFSWTSSRPQPPACSRSHRANLGHE